MQSYKCPKCEHETNVTKTITSKKNGKTYTVYKCINGCKNDKGFDFTFFPPKESPKPSTNVSGSDDLARIARALERLADKFCPPKKVNLSADPLEQAHNQEIDLNV